MTDADLIILAEREIASLPPASAAIMRSLVEKVRLFAHAGIVAPARWGADTDVVPLTTTKSRVTAVGDTVTLDDASNGNYSNTEERLVPRRTAPF